MAFSCFDLCMSVLPELLSALYACFKVLMSSSVQRRTQHLCAWVNCWLSILRGYRRDESVATAGHLARDGDCEKIRAGIPAAARSVNLKRLVERFGDLNKK
jgi:hypothetical protein